MIRSLKETLRGGASRYRESLRAGGQRVLAAAFGVILATGMALGVAPAAHAEDAPTENLGTPAHVKSISEKHNDGSYTISLNVSGKTQTSSEPKPIDVVLVMDLSNSMDDPSGTPGKNRLRVAKDAAKKFAETLLTKENEELPDNQQVRLQIVKFAAKARVQNITGNKTWSVNADEVQGVIDRLSTRDGSVDDGTNWKAALEQANKATTGRDGAEKHIIFLSDGEPNQGGTDFGILGPTHYQAAVDTANERSEGVGLFVVNAASESATLMSQLAKDAKGTYYNGSDQGSLESAFDSIVHTITKNYTYKNVSITDALSEYVDFAGIENGKPKNLKATVTKGQETNAISNPNVTVDQDNKTITWNLGSDSLDDGATYTVSFDVVPNQAAYNEAAAKGTNGSMDLPSNDADNTKVTYDVVKSETGKDDEVIVSNQSAVYNEKPTVNVPYATVKLEKQWQDSELVEHGDSVKVTLESPVDGVDDKTVELKKGEGWKTTVKIPAGVSDATWTVEEEAVAGYSPTVTGDVKVKGGEAGQKFNVAIENKVNVGDVSITKQVESADGRTAPGATFKFKVTFDTENGELSGDYTVVKPDDSQPSKVANGDTITLKAGQTATIKGLPAGAVVKAEETEADMPDGFSTEKAEDEVTVAANETMNLTFTNVYGDESVMATTTNVAVTKELKGLDLQKGQFTFNIKPDTTSATNTVVATAKNGSVENGSAKDAVLTLNYTLAGLKDAKTDGYATVDEKDGNRIWPLTTCCLRTRLCSPRV